MLEKNYWLIGASAAGFFAIAVAHAAPVRVPVATRPVLVATLGGTCKKLTRPGADWTRYCANFMGNEEYRDKRIEFSFVVKNAGRVSFSGNGLKQEKLSADIVRQPIDRLTIRLSGNIPPASEAATGECRYSNPYKGVSVVRCIARFKDGVQEAEFVTDGQEPSIQEF